MNDQILFIFVSRFCLICAYTRPRYQVSVYRTIGPLVMIYNNRCYTIWAANNESLSGVSCSNLTTSYVDVSLEFKT